MLENVKLMREYGLQFGHGCDTVETADTAAKRSDDVALQFGHGCDTVETAHWEIPANTQLYASIRPRL